MSPWRGIVFLGKSLIVLGRELKYHWMISPGYHVNTPCPSRRGGGGEYNVVFTTYDSSEYRQRFVL